MKEDKEEVKEEDTKEEKGEGDSKETETAEKTEEEKKKVDLDSSYKSDFSIEKHLRAELRHSANVFYAPLPFYATKFINPFLNSRISARLRYFQLIVQLL